MGCKANKVAYPDEEPAKEETKKPETKKPETVSIKQPKKKKKEEIKIEIKEEKNGEELKEEKDPLKAEESKTSIDWEPEKPRGMPSPLQIKISEKKNLESEDKIIPKAISTKEQTQKTKTDEEITEGSEKKHTFGATIKSLLQAGKNFFKNLLPPEGIKLPAKIPIESAEVEAKKIEDKVFPWLFENEGKVLIKSCFFHITYNPGLKGFYSQKSSNQIITSILSWQKKKNGIYKFAVKDTSITNVEDGLEIPIDNQNPPLVFGLDKKFI